jgi:LuxR family transcriptional regulator, maltose regulon positive regulatory protein
MAEVVSSSGLVRDGEAALARGDWEEARALFEQKLEVRETVEALEGLSWAAWWVEDVPTCLEARERAYRLCRRHGDARRAGMSAIWLANDYRVFRGESAIASGWLQRAARILEGAELCAAHGWLDAVRGFMAIAEGDQAKARELSVRARELGRRLGVVSLEMFALSVEGVALVTEGDIPGGMRCLDEAAAAALAGEYEEIVAAGWTCCLLLDACERVRDYERAGEWCGKVKQFSDRMRINFVTGATRAHYGAVLTWQGRWAEAERELTEATEFLAEQRPTWSGLAIVRLADLRRRQGRFAEAQELLRRAEGNALSPVVLADMSLDLGDASAAGDLLEPVLRRVPKQNRAFRLAPVEVMARAQAAAGETDAAAAHLSEVRSIAEAVGTRPLHATARLCEGLVAAAAGDDLTARAELEEAVDLFATSGAAFELARARLALARVLATLGREGAAAREAVLALERLEAIGAAAEAARARELLRDLGGPAAATPAVTCDELLTHRQLEVVRLVSQGLTDAEIAERLVLSKHTVHRHLQNAYARLGCSSRAAAVAEAHRLQLL